MFLSSSLIIIKYSGLKDIGNYLKNSYLKIQKEPEDTGDFVFYSINFYDENKTIGEIHWSESFNFGKMNLINFMRKEDYFILFTSTVQNFNVLKYILKELIGNNFELEVVTIPLKYKLEKDYPEIEGIVSIEEQNVFGISMILNIQDKYSFMKIYTNGLVTYTMTNDTGIIKKIIDIALALIKFIKGSEHS